ncbi:hypothetical protein [Streptomyces sp. GF20]|uniref:hypothetical protein n=1 Tax=Streptomyces sp. GF20 TaxID=2692235 RepID=UPI003FA6AA50
MHGSAGGKQVLTELAAAYPTVTKVWADGGYLTGVVQHGASLGSDVEVMRQPKAKASSRRSSGGRRVDLRLADAIRPPHPLSRINSLGVSPPNVYAWMPPSE